MRTVCRRTYTRHRSGMETDSLDLDGVASVAQASAVQQLHVADLRLAIYMVRRDINTIVAVHAAVGKA